MPVWRGNVPAEVLAGRLAASELESQKKLAERDKERQASARKVEYRARLDGSPMEVPQRVLDAEARDGQRRYFVQFTDRQGYPASGWYPKPPPANPAVQLEIERTGRDFTFDFLAGEWIPVFERPMPFEMKQTVERFGLEKDDARYPVYQKERGVWQWPSPAQTPPQEKMHRLDLESPNGFPLDMPPTGAPGKAVEEGESAMARTLQQTIEAARMPEAK